MSIAQIGLLVSTGSLAVTYAVGRRRGMLRVARWIENLIAAYALVYIIVLAYVAVNHLTFPLNLEAMELTMVQHLKRVAAGVPLYAEPTPEFVPLAYNPLFFYLALPVSRILGVSLTALRFVAVVGMLGIGAVVFFAVRRNTSSDWWGVIAVGLFAAAYRAMDTYLDNAHADSWMLFAVLAGAYLIDLSRSRWTNLIGVILAVAAFWFKQSGGVFAIGIILFLTYREGRRAWPYWLTVALLGPVLYLLAPASLLGPRFHYFTYTVPSSWSSLDVSAIARLVRFTGQNYLMLSLLAGAGFLLSLKRRPLSVWMFLLPFAFASAVLGVMDSESNNNVLIPFGVWLIICGALALHGLQRRLPGFQRAGLHVAVLGISFALLFFPPRSVLVSAEADTAHADLVSFLDALEGPVYAPWLGQLPAGYQFNPGVHWVPLTDMFRGSGNDFGDKAELRPFLESVIHPEAQQAYILMNFPLEQDPAIGFLREYYVLEEDLGERFMALSTLPKRYNLGWPQYLYRYSPPAVRSED